MFTYFRNKLNVLLNVFTSIRNALDLSVHCSDKELTKNMNEYEDIYVAVAEMYSFDGAYAFTLMNHKNKGHTTE